MKWNGVCNVMNLGLVFLNETSVPYMRGDECPLLPRGLTRDQGSSGPSGPKLAAA